MILTHAEAVRRVSSGAAFLDGVRPGWHDRVNLATLTLSDPCECIVAQLGGTVMRGGAYRRAESQARYGAQAAQLLGLSVDAYLDLATVTAALGFDFDWQQGGTPADFPALQEAWVAAITARRLPHYHEEPAWS